MCGCSEAGFGRDGQMKKTQRESEKMQEVSSPNLYSCEINTEVFLI